MKALIGSFIGIYLLVGCGNSTNRNSDISVDAVLENETLDTLQMKRDIPLLSFEDLERKYLDGDTNEIFILNFWATWCKPCVKELPAFEQLGAELRDQGVRVILVSLDFPEHVDKAVVPFVERNGLKNEVVLLEDPDANTWIPKISEKWSGAIPATLILKDGERFFYEQSFTYESLKNEVQPLINKSK